MQKWYTSILVVKRVTLLSNFRWHLNRQPNPLLFTLNSYRVQAWKLHV